MTSGPTEIVAVDDPETLPRTIEALAAGMPVIIPTDTVYGLASSASNPYAVAQLFAVKRRPLDMSIAALVAGVEQADEHVILGAARELVEQSWPGALTVVVPKRGTSDLAVGAEDGTVGVRAPASTFARALAEQVGPLAATSANRSGSATLETAAEMAAEFGHEVGLIIDAGPLTSPASTVVRITDGGLEVLRQGGVVIPAP